ncbi:hypothetical protein VTK26DRAFT_599 [Humicola hyalothermophila]
MESSEKTAEPVATNLAKVGIGNEDEVVVKTDNKLGDEVDVGNAQVDEPGVDKPKLDNAKADDETKVDTDKVGKIESEEVNANEAKVDEAKIDMVKDNDPAVNQAEVDNTKAIEVNAGDEANMKVDDADVDNHKFGVNKADEVNIDDSKVKTDEANLDNANMDEIKADDANVGEDTINQVEAGDHVNASDGGKVGKKAKAGKQAKPNNANTKVEIDEQTGRVILKTVVRRNPDYVASVKMSKFDPVLTANRIDQDIDRAKRPGNSVENLCVICDEPTVHFCSGCKIARYCSRDCQAADWAIHKKFCKEFAEGATAATCSRPSPDHHRIVYFPAYEENPLLIWGKHTKTDTVDGWMEFEHPDMAKFAAKTGPLTPFERRGSIILNEYSHLEGRPIGHCLVLYHFTQVPLDNPIDHVHLNQSHNALVKRGYLRPRFGPVVIFADARKIGAFEPKVLDITPRDIHTVVKLLESYDCTCIRVPARYIGKIISGLKINDVKMEVTAAMGIVDKFEEAMVPLNPSRRPDFVVAMAFLLGLRWYIRPGNFMNSSKMGTVWRDGSLRYLGCIATTPGVNYDSDGSQSDDEASFADYDAKENAVKIKACKVVFRYGPFFGSVVVMHASGNPIRPEHVLVFNAYLDHVYINKGVPSKEGFQAYWSEYKISMGKAWSSMESPYKWEKKKFPDLLGFHDPEGVMEHINCRAKDIWCYILRSMNSLKASDSLPPKAATPEN